MIQRLRVDPPEYGEGYDHSKWNDHRVRVERLSEIARSLDPTSAADLAAGDGAILDTLSCPCIYGDIVAHGDWVTGPIEETVEGIDHVDLFVCTEVLEHVRAPFELLLAIRYKASRLLLSTPVDNYGDTNAEHLWAWEGRDVADLLRMTGWTVNRFETLDLQPMGGYLTGIWVAS